MAVITTERCPRCRKRQVFQGEVTPEQVTSYWKVFHPKEECDQAKGAVMPTITLGVIIAIVVLLLAIVLGVIGQIPIMIAALIGLLALARIVP